MDAEAPLCLHRGRNSCGSRGSAQRDTVPALSRGLAGSIRALLSASSWSLLTASKEKVSPFSCRKEKKRRRQTKLDFTMQEDKYLLSSGVCHYALSAFFLSHDVGQESLSVSLFTHMDFHGSRSGPAQSQDQQGDGGEGGLHLNTSRPSVDGEPVCL